jgi:hypothetical protein
VAEPHLSLSQSLLPGSGQITEGHKFTHLVAVPFHGLRGMSLQAQLMSRGRSMLVPCSPGMWGKGGWGLKAGPTKWGGEDGRDVWGNPSINNQNWPDLSLRPIPGHPSYSANTGILECKLPLLQKLPPHHTHPAATRAAGCSYLQGTQEALCRWFSPHWPEPSKGWPCPHRRCPRLGRVLLSVQMRACGLAIFVFWALVYFYENSAKKLRSNDL